MKAVLITTRGKINTIRVRIGGHINTEKLIIKYLQVIIVEKINFKGNWTESMACMSNRRELNMAYRLVALKVCSVFREISGESAYVITGIVL